MMLSPNTRIGRYEIRSLLGKGGMGEVHLAYDTQLRRQVAIKLLPPEFTWNKGRLQRFEREAYAASSLNHPYILTIYEIGELDGQHFIATEYIEGESLRRHLTDPRMELREGAAGGFRPLSRSSSRHCSSGCQAAEHHGAAGRFH